MTNIIIMLAFPVAESALEALLEGVGKMIDQGEVVKLAPRTTAQQTGNAISTMVNISFAEKYTRSGRLGD